MNNSSGIEISDVARELHSHMIRAGANGTKLFAQKELQDQLPGNNPTLADLMLIVQELLDKNLIKLVKQNNELKFQAVDFQEAAKKSTMSNEEALVYSYIEASGREGIWSKTIKARTNLHQHVVLKCLKSLESQRYVKSVKSVKYPTRKIYMLYHLQPSVEVTGGPWFTEGELDVEFINSLLTIVWRFVAQNSFPNGFQNGGANGTNKSDSNSKVDTKYAPHVRSYSTAQEILDFIAAAQVANVELSTAHIRSLCTVLVYDDRLEEVEFDCYRATLTSLAQLSGPNGGAINNKSSGTDGGIMDDLNAFSIFDYHQTMGATDNDKEAVYFDEWAL